MSQDDAKTLPVREQFRRAELWLQDVPSPACDCGACQGWTAAFSRYLEPRQSDDGNARLARIPLEEVKRSRTGDGGQAWFETH